MPTYTATTRCAFVHFSIHCSCQCYHCCFYCCTHCYFSSTYLQSKTVSMFVHRLEYAKYRRQPSRAKQPALAAKKECNNKYVACHNLCRLGKLKVILRHHCLDWFHYCSSHHSFNPHLPTSTTLTHTFTHIYSHVYTPMHSPVSRLGCFLTIFIISMSHQCLCESNSLISTIHFLPSAPLSARSTLFAMMYLCIYVCILQTC